MLRQALDDAEAAGEKKRLLLEQEEEDAARRNEETSAAYQLGEGQEQAGGSSSNYGSIEDGGGSGMPEGDLESSNVHSSFYDDGEYSYDDDDDDDDDESQEDDEPDISVLEKVWDSVKAGVRVVANVENLWDSPDSYQQQTAARAAASSSRSNRSRRHSVVLFWFVVLAVSYASERSTFKLLVDLAGPFRLFSVQMVTANHSLMLGLGMLVSRYCVVPLMVAGVDQQSAASAARARQYRQQQSLPLGVPWVDVGLMALLDTVTLLLMFLTGSHVPPTLTVILVQFTIPLTAFLTQFMHPDGRWNCCSGGSSRTESSSMGDGEMNNESTASGRNRDESNRGGSGGGIGESLNRSSRRGSNNSEHRHSELIGGGGGGVDETGGGGGPLPGFGGLAQTHVWGSLILFLAVLLALCPAFYSIADPDFFIYADTIPIRTAVNTLLYASSCIPAAASQLYKEHIFLQYKQPVNMTLLNLLLSVFQFVFAAIVSPLAYGLQGMGGRRTWTTLYPDDEYSENLLDGLKCYFGLLDKDDQRNKYYEEADCHFTYGLVLLHVFAIIAVGVAVDKIVNAGATKVMYRGISAGIILAVLSMHVYDMVTPDFNYGPAVDGLNLVCLVLLILGAEVYHRESLQESTFETEYPHVEVPHFDSY